MQSKFYKPIIVVIMVLLIVAMMVATLVEKAGHSVSAFSFVYHNPVFIAAWAAVAILGMIELVPRKIHKRPAVLCIHLAFILILAGALTTHLFSDEGRIHLRIGESAASYSTKDNQEKALPFRVELKSFVVIRSAGGAPIDYVSTVETEGRTTEIAMNRILKKAGYRFFQAGYDEDEGGSYLSVSHDPWGTGISYAGYWLLFASMLAFFFDGKSRFREAIRRSRGTAAGIAALLCLCGGNQEASAAPKVLPKDVAKEFGSLYVNYNGRICPVQTMAHDYVMKVYGKPSVKGYTAEQVFTGWLYYYDSWKDVPVKCKKKDRKGPKELEKKQIVVDIAGGRDLKIFPVMRPIQGKTDTLVWYASASKLPFDMDDGEWMFIREVNSLIGEYAFMGKWDEASGVITKIAKYQLNRAAKVLPSATKIRAERAYNAIGRPFIPAMASITLGIILFLLMGFGIADGRKWLRTACHVLSAVAFLYITAVLTLRWYVSGHVPMSNGYEMMLIIAWLSLLLTAVFGLRMHMMHCFGFILAGFAMLVACLGQASPQIGTLMPVLSSPLLCIHVSCMMLSYTMLGLLALNGLLGLIKKGAAAQAMERGIIILYPAIFFLTAGTFIGAIWANVSWGNYWSWDPKETWSLITVLIYSMLLHTGSLRRLSQPKVFNAFCLIAFICVLITYFGVNFFLGGAHSYA